MPEHKHNKFVSQRGQSSAEYAIIISLTSILVIIVLAILGVELADVYCSVVGLFGDSPSQCSASLLWQETFDNLDGWDFTAGGGWVNEDGELCVNEGGEHRGFTGEEDWQDYTLKVDTATLDTGNGYGVYFRTSNEPDINSYVFQYDPGYRGTPYPNGAFLIRTVVNGGERGPIAAVAAPADFKWNDVSRSVEIDVRGDTFTVNIDGEQVMQTQDSTFTNGRVGLRSWDGTRACFDDLTVSS